MRKMRRHSLSFHAMFLWLGWTTGLLAGPPMVELELVLEPGGSFTASRDWLESVKDLGFSNIRIRQGQRGDTAEIREVGTPERPSYSVRGLVTRDNVLRVPGGSFRLGDKGGLRAWKDKLLDGGKDEVGAKPVMFGLTAKQMLEVHGHLKRPVPFSTSGMRTRDLLNQLADVLPLELAADGAAATAVNSETPCSEELQGYALGTALAAVLRPIECVFKPEKELGQPIRLLIREAAEAKEAWPVGWEVKGTPAKVAPPFYEVLPAEINNFVLADALTAIQKRTELPFLFDRSNLLRHKIDLTAVKVSTKKGRRTYASVVDDILYQGQCKSELRIDEADRPFLWISPLKQ
jgi:hypothetical protein